MAAVQGCARNAGAELEPQRGHVPLRLFERVCADSSAAGQIVAAQVVNARKDGLFARLKLQSVDTVRKTFHFEVLGLFDLDRAMEVQAPARSLPADVESTPNLCVRRQATLNAALDDEVVRFGASARAWHSAHRVFP